MIFQCHGLWITPIVWEGEKRVSGFCKMLVRAPRHGKWLQQVQWAGPGAINHHSDHISTVSLPQAELWMYVISGPIKNPWPLLRSCFIQGKQKESRLQDLIKVAFQSQDRPSFSKRIYFISSYFQHAIEYHVASASPVLCSMLRHTFTLQRAVSTLKTELRTKVQV